MAGHAKKCVERYCELANKTTQQLYKVSTPCIDDHHFKEEETKSVGELSNTCSQNFGRFFLLVDWTGFPLSIYGIDLVLGNTIRTFNRTVQPVCRHASHSQGARKTSRCQEIETRSFHEEAVKHDRTVQPIVGRNTSHEPSQQSRGMFNVLSNVDRVPSNVQFSHQEALLYVFEDNEAVIKMIIKGRSPAMRHVSRTHRVALDWLLDRINLDPKIQIKYIDTKNQLADILTKGEFHAFVRVFFT